jgi:hypothetical protein
MAEDIKLVIGTDNPTIVVTTVDKVNIRDAAKSSEINLRVIQDHKVQQVQV